MATHKPTLQVFRHASDDQAHNCGRACAQSIISSLTQGVAGTSTTDAQRAQPVPVTQEDLQALESPPIADSANRWFTHPNELRKILRESPHLVALGHTDWWVAYEEEEKDLLEHVGASLAAGFPAILNIRSNDHWVLVHGVDVTNGVVSFVRMLDPLNPHEAPGPDDHTYVDGCATDGEELWETLDLTAKSLGDYNLEVGTTEPADYQGKCVAIVYKKPKDLKDKRRLHRLQRTQRRSPGGATPLERIFEELTRISQAYDAPEVAALLRERREPTIRFVHDIDAKERGYTMSAVFSDELGYGLIGIYDFNDQAFLHARVTSDRKLVAGLAGDPAEPLWWTRGPLETLFSPYFPFRRVPDQLQPTYRRLADDFEIKTPSPKGTQRA
jgi:hypothetical protein